jgi:hypothetical protein
MNLLIHCMSVLPVYLYGMYCNRLEVVRNRISVRLK